MLEIIIIVLATLLCGLSLSLRELPVVSGCVQASGAGETTIVKILFPVLTLAAIIFTCFFPGAVETNLESMMSPEMAGGQLIPIGIATATAVVVSKLISRFPAVPLAFTGVLIGAANAAGNAPAWSFSASYLISWIVAPLLCGALAAGIYVLCAKIGHRRNRPFLFHESNILKGSVVAGIVLIGASARNNASLLTLLPGTVRSGPIAAAAIALSCTLIIYVYTRGRMSGSKWEIADAHLDISSLSTFSLISAMALVFAIFSSSLVARTGLAPAPLSAGVLFVAALTGISLARSRALIDGDDILRCAAAAVVAPLIGALAGFSLCRLAAGDAINTMLLAALAILTGGLLLYFRRKAGEELQQQIRRSREQQLYNTQRSIDALEVKAEMTEKELLGKLEGKRKELVDFAVGISDQKKFMEDIYESLRELRSMPDGKAKDTRTDELLSSLRERMYFTREMNDFYARSEMLHHDFNTRLNEKFPDLTQTERKLSNLLRQGFSSKYIASLMNITPKSVEISRYRLRTKLGLGRDDNLIQFIKSI